VTFDPSILAFQWFIWTPSRLRSTA